MLKNSDLSCEVNFLLSDDYLSTILSVGISQIPEDLKILILLGIKEIFLKHSDLKNGRRRL